MVADALGTVSTETLLELWHSEKKATAGQQRKKLDKLRKAEALRLKIRLPAL